MSNWVLINVPVKPEMAQKARIGAAMLGVPRTELFRRALSAYLDKLPAIPEPVKSNGKEVRREQRGS